MDSREGLRERAAWLERDRVMMAHPGRWPAYPFLALARRA